MLVKLIKYDVKKVYYVGLFYDICKELDENEFRVFIN